MPNITEPKMLLTATEVIELVSAWKALCDNPENHHGLTQLEILQARGRYDYHENLATRKIKSMNSKIWSN